MLSIISDNVLSSVIAAGQSILALVGTASEEGADLGAIVQQAAVIGAVLLKRSEKFKQYAVAMIGM